MKKATLIVVRDALQEFGYANAAVMDELNQEINKGEAKKAENAALYDAFKPLVMGALTATPATIAELWKEIEPEAPEGVNQHKLQYALTHLWKDEIAVVPGKPNGYAKKAE